MDMSFLFPKAVVYGAIVMSTIADAGRHSLPIKRTTTGLYWKDPAVFQQTHVFTNRPLRSHSVN
jgi:hypothetical protein